MVHRVLHVIADRSEDGGLPTREWNAATVCGSDVRVDSRAIA